MTIQLEILFIELDEQTQKREAKKRVEKYARQREYKDNVMYESVHINGKEVYLK